MAVGAGRQPRLFSIAFGPARLHFSFDVKRTPQFRVGDSVTVVKIPPGLVGGEGLDTAGVFRRALGKTFRVDGIDEHGHLELVVAERRASPDTYHSDTIWIEPGFVVVAEARRGRK